MRKLLLFLMCAGIAAAAAADSSVERVRRQFIEYYAMRELPMPQAEKYLASIRPDGSWADIDYANTAEGRWPTLIHLTRARMMAGAWADPQSGRHGDERMADAAVRALEYWVGHDFRTANWWHTDIGIPQSLGASLIMLGERAPASLLERSRPLLERSAPGKTGQNRIWLAGVHIMKGCLWNEPGMIAEGARQIFAETAVAPRGKEGLQPDWSFHQHGPQQQFGNYGLSYAESQVQWGLILRGTPFGMPPEKAACLRSYFLDGLNWTIRGGFMDISSCGRHLYGNSNRQKARSARTAAGFAAKFDAVGRDRLRAMSEGAEPAGNRYFWCSDYMIHRRKDYFYSVRMSSERVIGTESYNNENLQGKYLGDGAAYLMRDAKEYDNIYPFWNWKQLPGVTAMQDRLRMKPWAKNFENKAAFVGGVSDGETGLAVMQLKRREPIEARKAYFAFDRYIVCLGAGITAESKAPVVTGVEQRLQEGAVRFDCAGESGSFTEGTRRLRQVRSLHHDGVGYYFPAATDLEVGCGPVSGSWRDVNRSDSAEAMARPVFRAVIDHGVSPRNAAYGWIVSPDGSDPEEAGIEITASAGDVLAAIDRGNRVAMGVCFGAGGRMALPGGAELAFTSPAAAMAKITPHNTLRLTVSDPAQRQGKLRFTISGRYSGEGCRCDEAAGITEVVIPLGTGDAAGKSVSVELKGGER
ncbi:polysaccharide lyase family 8 super-sandwich domain-containing protein [Victivallis lenta]|uniref:polysaccharide lyase family 8 super-sandwich domain-containing protein n=2 Tax=Victivallis lenta TaxID=2606640 RepID=UPI000D039FE1|nr:polysaccharide lyase family 8 super-sandwich domain-containing protein [Victivallis lenta]AVM44401.1 hypothetical protein C5Q97_06605 [Victivallales bacterium CCUG 44730]